MRDTRIHGRYLNFILLLFGASILLPQGVGIRLPGGLPNLDLPRIAILGLQGLFVFRILSYRSFPNNVPRTFLLLFLLIGWQFLSAFFSESPVASFTWAVSSIMAFLGFAFAFLALAGSSIQRNQVAKTLTIVAILLASWAVIELITQTKLVPYRNIWSNADYVLFSTTLRRTIPGVGHFPLFMSIGPYATNLTLAGVLCALGGFLIMHPSKKKSVNCLLLVLFILSVLSTQSRSGFIALLVMFFIFFIWARPLVKLFFVLGVVTTILILTIKFYDNDMVIFFFKYMISSIASDSDSIGGLSGRSRGISLLLSQIDRWWLFGFGPGSLLDSDRVVTSIDVFGDPGSFFVFFFESGLPAGLLITAIVFTSIVHGLKSTDLHVRAATLGLIGFIVTSLSSITFYGWGLAIILAGLIESWVKTPSSPSKQVLTQP